MELIDRKKIENDAYKQFPYGSLASIGSKERSIYELKKESHLQGVLFAETELKNLAIEFAKWIGDNEFSFSERQEKWVKRSYSYGNITGSEIISDTTQQLFEIFLSKRNK